MAYQPSAQHHAESIVRRLINEGAKHLGLEQPSTVDVHTEVREAGTQYAVSTPRSRRSLRLAAETDGLILDPTYTAKGFAAMLRWIEEERIEAGESILFIHTGGLPSLFSQTWEELSAV